MYVVYFQAKLLRRVHTCLQVALHPPNHCVKKAWSCVESDQEAYHLKKTRKYKIRFKENVLQPSRQTGHKIHMKMITMIGNLEIPAAWWFVCLCTAICCESTPYCDLCCSYGTGQAQKCDHDRFLQSLKHGRHSIGRMLKQKQNKNFITFNETGKETAFQCCVMLQLLIMENKIIECKT